MAFSSDGLQALAWTPLGISTIIIALRLYIRARIHNTCSEDHLMAIAWACAISTASFATVTVQGTVRNDESTAEIGYFGAVISGVLSLLFSKVSVALQLLRLTGRTSRWRRRILLVNLGLYVLLSLGALIVNIVQPCATQRAPFKAPICFQYDAKIEAGWVLAWSVHGAFLDVAFSIIAMSIVRAVQLSLSKKIGLYVLFGIGWIGGPFSILRAIYGRAVANNVDLFWLSTALEIPLVIICASVPTLMPLFQYWKNGKPISPRDGSKGKSSIDTVDSAKRRLLNKFRRGQRTNEEMVQETEIRPAPRAYLKTADLTLPEIQRQRYSSLNSYPGEWV